MKKSIALLSLLVLGASSFNAVAKEETKKEAITLKSLIKKGIKPTLGAYLLYLTHEYTDSKIAAFRKDTAFRNTIDDLTKIAYGVIFFDDIKDFLKEVKGYSEEKATQVATAIYSLIA